MEREPKLESAPIVNREMRVGETVFVNYSGKSLGEAMSFFSKRLSAEKIVVMPDLNPGRAPLPSGCSVEFSETKVPNWRKYVLSDIGCGMQVLETQLKWGDFEERLADWDSLYPQLKSNKGGLGDLGSGNHFIDAAIDDAEKVYFVIHTGSRHQASRAEALLDQPEKFDQVYAEIQEWAVQNRGAVRDLLNEAFGQTEVLFDRPHNTFTHEGDKIVIYKGTVNLRLGEQSLIPSSMDTDMVIVEGKEPVVSRINYTLPHGTGRLKSRGSSKADAYTYDFDALRKRIHIPDSIRNESILTENPSCYRSLDQCLEEISDLIIIKNRLHPVAYVGQI